MKKKFIFLTAVLTLLLVLLPACDARKTGSLKSITKPYLAQYECTEATFGGEDILKEFEYIEIILVDKEKMELIYKPKNSEKHKVESTYSFDTETRELTAEIGIYGYTFRERTVVEHGKFTVSKAIGGKQLIMKFLAK